MLASDHPSTDGIVELSQLVQAVLTATGRCATLRKLSLNRRRRFSHDFALIAASVRCAYLLDAFSVGDQVMLNALVELLASLRLSIGAFKNVVCVHEPITGQLFFVNRPLANAILPCEDKSAQPWTLFLDIEKISLTVSPTNSVVIDLIRQIIEHPANEVLLQLTIPLDDTSAPETLMVPLAGVLLEYPLAYVPGSRAGSHSEGYLSGVPLDVYECLIQNSTTGGGFESTLLKFSCPHTLGQKYPELATGTVHERLYTRFNQRLRSANLGNLSVNHSIVALDRVAL